jgi:hypothetical protein
MRTFFIGEDFFIHFFILDCLLIAGRGTLNVILVDILNRYCVFVVIRTGWSHLLLIVATTSCINLMSFQMTLKRYTIIKNVKLL